jgi:hypothetical protein
MRGGRYTAPPLTSTGSVVCQLSRCKYSTFFKQRTAPLFITPSVPFAERRFYRYAKIAETTEKYNEIIAMVETDPSLRIEFEVL